MDQGLQEYKPATNRSSFRVEAIKMAKMRKNNEVETAGEGDCKSSESDK